MQIEDYGIWLAFPIVNPDGMQYRLWDFYDTQKEIEKDYPNYQYGITLFHHNVNVSQVRLKWENDKISKVIITDLIRLRNLEPIRKLLGQMFDCDIKHDLEPS